MTARIGIHPARSHQDGELLHLSACGQGITQIVVKEHCYDLVLARYVVRVAADTSATSPPGEDDSRSLIDLFGGGEVVGVPDDTVLDVVETEPEPEPPMEPKPEPEPKPDDVGNTSATAMYISLNEPPEGATAAEGTGFGPWELTEGDVDYFKFILADYYTFGVLSSDETDTYGVLYDDEGNVISSNNDHKGEPGFFVVGTRLEPGSYYLKVTGNNGATGSYYLAAALARDRSRLGKPTVATATATTPQQRLLQKLELELEGL